MTYRRTRPDRGRVAAFSAALALLAAGLALSCDDGPAEPDPPPIPPAPPPVRPEVVPLRALYESTNGPAWHRRDNWLTDAPVETWHGVTVDSGGRVIGLDLRQNNLTGEIPPDLGNLAHLKLLLLENNDLTGTIPRELGSLASLERLQLQENGLTGGIPSELEKLTSLTDLWLNGNDLTGGIPPELGGISSLARLGLRENRLGGAIPPELGRLEALGHLLLADNDLTGGVPSEFGRLTQLRRLDLSGNTRLSGALPASLTALDHLQAIEVANTDLCAPMDRDFQSWIQGISSIVPRCLDNTGPTTVYLTQAVQSRSIPVPLVANRSAWLRVFVTAADATSEVIPPVRATFYVDDAETYTFRIPTGTTPIPTALNEGVTTGSANAYVPGEIIQPGLELVVEIDPEGTLDPALGVGGRIPERGRIAVEVREMPTLDLTLIPFLWSTAADSAIIGTIAAMAADPGGHPLLQDTRSLLPVSEVHVTTHEPVLSSSNEARELLSQTAVIRQMEGGRGHFMGMMSGSITGWGVAQLRGRSSFAPARGSTIAHELGHNMSLRHAPCGDPTGGDPAYPRADGTIGSWGWGAVPGGWGPIPPSMHDLMSYCHPRWISGYHFTKAMLFRAQDERTGDGSANVATAAAGSLLLWGGVDAGGHPFFEPAFVVDAPPALPEPGGGAFELVGWTTAGGVAFRLGFDMPEIADADGASSFAFLLPTEADWAGGLAAITLAGPGGTATLDGDTDRPMVILRNPRSGQVRAFLRDPPPAALAEGAADIGALGAESGLEALFSRGLPGPGAWRR